MNRPATILNPAWILKRPEGNSWQGKRENVINDVGDIFDKPITKQKPLGIAQPCMMGSMAALKIIR